MCHWGRFFLARFVFKDKTCQKEPSPLAHESERTVPTGTFLFLRRELCRKVFFKCEVAFGDQVLEVGADVFLGFFVQVF